MFELTKRQFLKKSAKCMDEAGGVLLLLKELIDQESQGKVSNQEASKKIDNIRKEIESIFYRVDGLNQPSSCDSLKQKILNILIKMQEIVVSNSEYLTAVDGGLDELSQNKLDTSRNQLEIFRKDFHGLTKTINIILTKKRKT